MSSSAGLLLFVFTRIKSEKLTRLADNFGKLDVIIVKVAKMKENDNLHQLQIKQVLHLLSHPTLSTTFCGLESAQSTLRVTLSPQDSTCQSCREEAIQFARKLNRPLSKKSVIAILVGILLLILFNLS